MVESLAIGALLMLAKVSIPSLLYSFAQPVFCTVIIDKIRNPKSQYCIFANFITVCCNYLDKFNFSYTHFFRRFCNLIRKSQLRSRYYSVVKNFFVTINFHSLLCILNETKHSHTSSSYFTSRVSYIDLYVINIISKKAY